MRTRRKLGILVALAVAAGTAGHRPASAQSMPPGMAKVYFALLKKGPGWTPGSTPETKAIQAGHMANIEALWKEGKLIVAGPVEDAGDLRGIFVLEAGSREDAAALAARDPAIKAGRLAADIVPWWVERRALPVAGEYCTPAARETGATLPAPLARVLTDYETAWRAKDAAGLAALFAEDGFVLPGGKPPVRGRAAILEHYQGAGGPLSLRALDYATEGSTGYIIGAYARQAGEPDIGKFTLTLRKGAGERWLIVSDMDNGNQRP
jgi:uncharacterized protein YciI